MPLVVLALEDEDVLEDLPGEGGLVEISPFGPTRVRVVATRAALSDAGVPFLLGGAYALYQSGMTGASGIGTDMMLVLVPSGAESAVLANGDQADVVEYGGIDPAMFELGAQDADDFLKH